MRKLGLDIGKKTIGVAISDEGAITAQPFDTIRRSSLSKDLDDVAALAATHEVDTIVAGLPLNMDGTDSAQTVFVRKFVELLRQRTAVDVVTWDERLSTMAVERILIEGDLSRGRRKEVVDKMAASYILQGYLDSLRKGERP